MLPRHLQGVAETEVRMGVVLVELRNNGGQFDCIAMSLLFNQRVGERSERLVVERTQLCGGMERLGLKRPRAGAASRGTLPQKVKES